MWARDRSKLGVADRFSEALPCGPLERTDVCVIGDEIIIFVKDPCR